MVNSNVLAKPQLEEQKHKRNTDQHGMILSKRWQPRLSWFQIDAGAEVNGSEYLSQTLANKLPPIYAPLSVKCRPAGTQKPKSVTVDDICFWL